VSTVWETTHRLLVERHVALAEQLSAEEPVEPAVLEEHTVRLLLVVLTLLGRHRVNKRGRCRFCGRKWSWRVWRPQPRCTVFRTVEHAMGQGLDVVWWELFAACGGERGMAQVREWVDGRPSERGLD